MFIARLILWSRKLKAKKYVNSKWWPDQHDDVVEEQWKWKLE